MDSKTRAKLRSLSNKIKPSVIIGKEGITDNVVKQTDMNLTAHELVKISANESDVNLEEMLNTLSNKTNAEPVCVLGKKLVIYRYSTKKRIKHILDV